MTQLVSVRFRPDSQRGYTYHNDGEPLAVGDFVEVDVRGNPKVVEVFHLPDERPPFETKPINRKVEQPADWPTVA